MSAHQSEWLRRVPLLGLLAVASTGCLSNAWHEEHFVDHLTYPSADAATMRKQLTETLAFLKTIGLKPVDQPRNDPAATEAVLIRDFGDHFHITVTVRGVALINKPEWAVLIRVESYNIGEEGAENAGHALLKEIDNWQNRPAGVKAIEQLFDQPDRVGTTLLKITTQPSTK